MKPVILWALRLSDGTWLAPDHFASARTPKAENAKPLYERSVAEMFQRTYRGSEIVPHPHPEIWGRA